LIDGDCQRHAAPSAALIVNGIKDVENRTWPTRYRRVVLPQGGPAPFRFITARTALVAVEADELGQRAEIARSALSRKARIRSKMSLAFQSSGSRKTNPIFVSS
jgi:hypothetical protein